MNVLLIILSVLFALAFAALCVIAIIRIVKKKKALPFWIAAAACFVVMIPVSIVGSSLMGTAEELDEAQSELTPSTFLSSTVPVLALPDTSQPNDSYLNMMGEPTDLTPLADYINEVLEEAGSSGSAEVQDEGCSLHLALMTNEDEELVAPILEQALEGRNVVRLGVPGAFVDVVSGLNCAYLGLDVSGWKSQELQTMGNTPNLYKVFASIDQAPLKVLDEGRPQLTSVAEVELYGYSSTPGSHSDFSDYGLNTLKLYPSVKRLVLQEITHYYDCAPLKTIDTVEEVVIADGTPAVSAYFAMVAQGLENIRTINGQEAATYDPLAGLEEEDIAAANTLFLYALTEELMQQDIPESDDVIYHAGAQGNAIHSNSKNIAVFYYDPNGEDIKDEGCSEYYSGENAALAEVFNNDVRDCNLMIIMYPMHDKTTSYYGRNTPAYSTTVCIRIYDLERGVCSKLLEVFTEPPPESIPEWSMAGYGEFRFDEAWEYIEKLYSNTIS